MSITSAQVLILDAAVTVHREMGPGLLESVYQHCLARELYLRDIEIETNVAVPLIYRAMRLTKNMLSTC
jgi:GxxExxY protein